MRAREHSCRIYAPRECYSLSLININNSTDHVGKMATGRLTQSTLFQCADFQISTNSSKPLKRKSIQEDVNRSSCSSDEESSSCSLHPETKKKSLQLSEQCWSDTTDSEDICLEGETSRCSVLSKNPQSNPSIILINSSLSSTPGVQSGCSKVPDDIASTTAFPPVQPVNITFPVTVYSGKSRSFNPAWYSIYPWLEYSIQKDACYCYSCRLLGSGPGSKCEKIFTLVGFKDWKHATGKSGVLSKHDASCVHRKSVISWNQYKINSERKTSISDRLETCRSQQITQNRHYMKTLAEIILLCSHQEIALHGHIEDESSMNRGNFLEILNLVANHDPVIKDQLKNGPKNAKYTSPEYRILL